MVDSHCEILWAENSGENLWRHPTENYAAGLDDASKQAIITQQCIRSKILGIFINNYLTSDSKKKVKLFQVFVNLQHQV